MKAKDMTVQDLVNALLKVEDKKRLVKVWMPGRRITLSSVIAGDADVLIEGNSE